MAIQSRGGGKLVGALDVVRSIGDGATVANRRLLSRSALPGRCG
jgi:hypothetical protein